nr:uncharacterized protein LOC111417649 [Onthophagus taurus]
MTRNYIVLYLLVFLSPIYIFIDAADERCYKIPPIKHFDVEKITGIWYAQQVGDLDGDESSRKCLMYSFVSNKNKSGVTLTVFRIYNVTGFVAKVEMFKIHQVKNCDNEYKVDWKEGQKGESGWTVDTDYENWATGYLCKPEEADRGMLFIGTRKKNPNKAVLEAAQNAARKVGFKMTKSYLKEIDHSRCFN